MNITTARKAAKNPAEFSTEDLHDALDVIVSDERFTEGQVEKFQAAIETELQTRRAGKLTDPELFYALNRFIFHVEAKGRYADATVLRAIRERSFDFKAMDMED